MQELKEKAKQLEITIKNRGNPTSIDDLLNKEQAIRDYLEVKRKLACIQYYGLV